MPGVLLALVAASRNSRGQDKQDRKPARRRPAKAQETAFRWVAFALAIVAGIVEAQWTIRLERNLKDTSWSAAQGDLLPTQPK